MRSAKRGGCSRATTAETRGSAWTERLLGTEEPSGLEVDHPLPLRDDDPAAAVDDQAEELQVDPIARLAARLLLRAVGAARVRPGAAVLVAGRARVPVPVVAVLAGAELVDGSVLAVAHGVERPRRHVEAHRHAARVGERAAHVLPVLAAAAPAPAALPLERGLDLERLAPRGRVGDQVRRRFESTRTAPRPEDRGDDPLEDRRSAARERPALLRLAAEA